MLAPDSRRLTVGDVARLLGGARPHHARGGGLERGRQMVAMRGDQPVGVAAFDIEDTDLLVHVLAVAQPEGEVLSALLAALELACLAAGAARVAVTAHADADTQLLAALGYEAATGRPSWLVRRLT